MNIIETIRAEIERRMKESKERLSNIVKAGMVAPNEEQLQGHLAGLLSFLDTLEESERPEPYNPVYDEAYLNEKIKKATESWKGVDVDAMLAECRGYDEEKSEKPMQEGLEEEIQKYMSERWEFGCINPTTPVYLYDFTTDELKECARHFAKWGAEQSGSSEIPNNHEGLDEAAEGIVCTMINECSAVGIPNDHIPSWVQDAMIAACKAGAKWREEQFEKNRLAACENQTKEEYDRETDFAIEIINKEHRQPTFSDAINYGMRLQKEQMMREEVEMEVGRMSKCLPMLLVTEPTDSFPAPFGKKVKVFIIKEDEK